LPVFGQQKVQPLSAVEAAERVVVIMLAFLAVDLAEAAFNLDTMLLLVLPDERGISCLQYAPLVFGTTDRSIAFGAIDQYFIFRNLWYSVVQLRLPFARQVIAVHGGLPVLALDVVVII